MCSKSSKVFAHEKSILLLTDGQKGEEDKKIEELFIKSMTNYLFWTKFWIWCSQLSFCQQKNNTNDGIKLSDIRMTLFIFYIYYRCLFVAHFSIYWWNLLDRKLFVRYFTTISRLFFHVISLRQSFLGFLCITCCHLLFVCCCFYFIE